MSASLKDLQRALTGEIGFSSALEDLANALFNGKLPAMWARLNPATEKPLGSWMLWFQRRYKQVRRLDGWVRCMQYVRAQMECLTGGRTRD
jgi:dynein heavy chain